MENHARVTGWQKIRAFDKSSHQEKMITDGLYNCNQLYYRLRNQLKKDFGIFSCQYLWSKLVSKQEQWSVFTVMNLSWVVYTRVYSVNLMCSIASIKCCHQDTFPNKHQSYRFDLLFSVLPGVQHIRSRNTALVQPVVGMRWFLTLWIKNTISKVTRQSYVRLMSLPVMAQTLNSDASDASVWNSWHEALGTPFLIGSSLYFPCKGCNHFIGQFLPRARDLRDKTQTDPRRICSANQVEVRVCSCVLLLFFFSKFLVKTLIFGVCFSLRFLSCGDGDPSKPHLNLRGKYFSLSLSLRKLPYLADLATVLGRLY